MKMKSIAHLTSALKAVVGLVLLALMIGTAQAQTTYVKQNNATLLNTTGSWSPAGTPAGIDTAAWTANIATAGYRSIALGGNVTWGQILLNATSAGGDITIANTPGSTLTLNGVSSVGIDMSVAANNLTISDPISLSAVQTWNIGSGRTLTLPNGYGVSGIGGITKTGAGKLIIIASTAINTYSGATVVNGGTLQFGTELGDSWANGALSPNSNLEINGGIVNAGYYLTRTLGTAGGQIQLTGGRSGFMNSLQADASANFLTFTTTGTTVTWGTATFNPSTLVLSDVGAVCVLRMPNPFDLNGAARTIEVSATGVGGGRGTYGTLEGNLTSTGGSLIKTGVGTLLLNGSNSYGGGTTINQGGLWFNKLVSMPASGAVTVNDGTVLGITVGTGGWTTGTSGNGTIGGLLSGLGGQAGGTVSYVGNAKVGLYLTGIATYAGVIADVGTTLGIHVGNKDAGTGSDPFTASSALTLSGQNTYTGGTTVNIGTLTLGHASNTLADTGAVTVNGGTLGLGANSDTVGAVTLASGTISSSTGVLTPSSVDAQSGTISAILGGSGVLTKSTSGTVTFSGSQSFTGGVIINGGNLTLGVSQGFSGGVAVNSGGTLVINTTQGFAGGVTLASGGQITVTSGLTGAIFGTGELKINGGRIDVGSAGGSITTTNPNAWNASWTMGRGTTGTGTWNNNGNILLGGNITVSSANNFTYLNLGGVISDGANSYGLTLNTSSATLSNANTYDGGTSFSTALNINHAGALGTGALSLSGGTIDNTSAGTITLSNNNVFNITGNFTFTGTRDLSNGTGNFTINGTRTITVTANKLTLGGNQTTVVAGGINKAGNGTLALLGSGVQTGAATVSGGVLEVGVMNNGGNASSVGNLSNAAANLKLNNGTTLRYVGSANATTDRAFTIDSGTVGHGATIEASGSGTFSFSGGPALAYGTGGQTRFLTIGGTNTGNNTFGKVIPNNGVGAVSLIKAGVGTWVLSQANTYTGTTTINGGTLALGTNNALPSASAISMGTGTLEVATYTNTVNTLDVTGAAIINLGTGGKLVFADSSGVNSGTWGGTLSITGAFVSRSSIKFGTSSGGLSAAQLGKISIPGGRVGIDDNGYLLVIRPTLISFF